MATCKVKIRLILTIILSKEKGDKYTKLSIVEKKRLEDLEDAIKYILRETKKYRKLAQDAAVEVIEKNNVPANSG